MTDPRKLLGIPPEAAPASAALATALDRMAREGRTPPCTHQPDEWFADPTDPTRHDAAEACQHCPAQHPCAAFAYAANEQHGVWGGTDRTPRPRQETASHASR